MFDIGFWELVILFGLGLLVLGPERLPRVAMQIGNWAGQARRMARTLTSQIRDELDIDVNRPFDTGYSKASQKPESWKRPGVDDLKPGGQDETPGSESGAEEKPPSTSDMTTDTSADTASGSQPGAAKARQPDAD